MAGSPCSRFENRSERREERGPSLSRARASSANRKTSRAHVRLTRVAPSLRCRRSRAVVARRRDERLSHRLHLERKLSSRGNRCASRSFRDRRGARALLPLDRQHAVAGRRRLISVAVAPATYEGLGHGHLLPRGDITCARVLRSTAARLIRSGADARGGRRRVPRRTMNPTNRTPVGGRGLRREVAFERQGISRIDFKLCD